MDICVCAEQYEFNRLKIQQQQQNHFISLGILLLTEQYELKMLLEFHLQMFELAVFLCSIHKNVNVYDALNN